MDKNLKALEFDKILHMLLELVSCEGSDKIVMETEPSTGLFEAKQQLKETSDAYMLINRFGSPSFSGVKSPINALVRAQAGGVLTMSELLRVCEALRIIRSLTQWHKKNEGMETSLDVYFDGLVPNKPLEERISSAIISEEEMADNASPELASIRRRIRNASSKARDVLDKMVHSSTYQKHLQDPIVTIRDGRFVVPVKNECRANVPGLVHDTSSSGSTLFIEPMAAVDANNQVKVLKAEEEKEIERILFALSALAGENADSIAESFKSLLLLDVIFAKAKLAIDMKATEPDLNDKGEILLKQARHPLIDKRKVVPIDIQLGISFDTLMITGPNTGGKTVSLKTLGLLSIMAMCGFMIPVNDNSRISTFEKVLVDIGDEQSIEQSLSTFSAHMTNIISIQKAANDRSLILIDELGSGTDPIEGAALAIAIIENFRAAHAKLASTTHYAELKAFALETDGVENGSCEFDITTLKPTYRLLIGVPGRSNAFAISRRLGMEDHIVKRAETLVSQESRRFEDIVKTLEDTRSNLEKELAEAKLLSQRAKEEKQKAQSELESIKAQSEKNLEKARQEAKAIADRTKAQAYALMDEIDALRKKKNLTAEEKSRLREGIKQMEEHADPIAKKNNEDYVLPRPLKVGDDVLIFDIDKKATVLKEADNSGKVLVQAGIIKTKVDIKNLRLLDRTPKKTVVGYTTRTVKSNVDARPATDVDLRGLSAVEAIMELDNAIDAAIMSGMGQITIIHGKGTGVLRREVHIHLKSHKSIKSFRLGKYGEGEAGVTIAELK